MDRGHLGKGLGGRATRGAAATFAGQWGRFALQTGSVAVLGRLLTPEDYGLLGMVIAVVAFAELLRDLGLSTATIQRRGLTEEQVNALFWINVAVGGLLTLVVAASSPLLAAFYERPEVQGMTLVVSINFLLGGFVAQHIALLNRNMRLGTVMTIELAALAVASALAITAALLGAGFWALAIREVTLAAARVPMVWWASPWRPGRPARAEGVGGLISFGANLSAFQLMNNLSRNLDNVLLGRFSSAAQLGLYTRAYALLMLPIRQINGPLNRVAVPTLSYLQDQPERFRRYYGTAVSIIAFLALPLFVLLAALSDEVILVVLGAQWTEAAPIFQVLVFAGLAQTIGYSSGWLYTATGHTGRQAVWGLISRPVIIASFAIGLPWGAYGVATAYAVASFLILPFGLWNAMRDTPVDGRDLLHASWRPLLSTVVLYAAAAVTVEAVPAGPFLRGLVAGAAGVAAFAAVVWIWPAARAQLLHLITSLRSGLKGAPVAS